jgi:hypothetical protein
MATLAELRAVNENILAQIREWKRQRYAHGEDPMDWVAFRQHVQQIGAPDPGESPPEEFHRWDETMGGERAGPEGAAASQAPAEGEQSPRGKAISEVNSLHPDPAATADDTATWPRTAASGSETSLWPPRSTSEKDSSA